MILAGVIGATGYAGLELVRLLLQHKKVELKAVSSVSFEGKKLSEVYPSLYGVGDYPLCDETAVIERCDVIFGSLPHGLSQQLAEKCLEKGKAFIDLGADFRLESAQEYEQWYQKPYTHPQLHEQAVYGLCEINRAQIRNTKLVANPGCYPTSISLGLAPALHHHLIDPNTLILDSKSGVTGAGRGLSQTTHYPDCNEAFSPYKIANHRHTPEIEQMLSHLAGQPVKVTFVPHLLPVNRGILSTMYASKTTDLTLEQIHALYREFYQGERFVRVLPLGEVANIKYVKYSNYCDISLHQDAHTGRLIVVSAIDNMVKGAAGQAIQNMNIIFGLEESTGLQMIPPAF